ncbi:MAG: hypothetical protein E6J58_13635 [Deltaproteobacteria bacterium]|nr:MAG: hypothetical protein E6J58_13635 [Deltaproteobacteria bacterium]
MPTFRLSPFPARSPISTVCPRMVNVQDAKSALCGYLPASTAKSMKSWKRSENPYPRRKSRSKAPVRPGPWVER